MGNSLKKGKKKKENKSNKPNQINEQKIEAKKNEEKINVNVNQPENENQNNNAEANFQKKDNKEEAYNENDDQDDIFKNAKKVEKQDTSGRISLLFYGPCHSGKSQISKCISEMSKNESSGAFVGVGYFKKGVKIKDKNVSVDCYDIGSYNGNETKKAWFIERCNLFIIVFDPTTEDYMNEIRACFRNILIRKNKDPFRICLCATKMDLIDERNCDKLEQVENYYKDYKLYKVNKDAESDIHKMFMEFIEESYDFIKDTLHGIDDLDIMNSEDYSYFDNIMRAYLASKGNK